MRRRDLYSRNDERVEQPPYLLFARRSSVRCKVPPGLEGRLHLLREAAGSLRGLVLLRGVQVRAGLGCGVRIQGDVLHWLWQPLLPGGASLSLSSCSVGLPRLRLKCGSRFVDYVLEAKAGKKDSGGKRSSCRIAAVRLPRGINEADAKAHIH